LLTADKYILKLPEGYSISKIEEIASKIDAVENNTSETSPSNIIVIMNEAFSDIPFSKRIEIDNLKNLKAQQEQERINNENRKNVLEKVKSEIQDKFISVYLKVGADGKNFGHITSKYVCDEFEAQTGIHLDKKKVEIPVINSVGIYTASVKLDKDIVATFEVNVIEK
jgi:ribosomal protein L9